MKKTRIGNGRGTKRKKKIMEPQEIRTDIRERVMRIETIVERMENHLSNLNNRTAKLENWKAWSAGGFASLGLIITLMKIGII